MLIVKTRLKEVSDKGIGLIADQEIKKDQTVWVYNPVIDIKLNKKDIPKEAKDFFNTYAVDIGENCLYLNIDNFRFINHSENPNIKSLGSFENNVASKDIRVGEELTINYIETDVSEINFEIK